MPAQRIPGPTQGPAGDGASKAMQALRAGFRRDAQRCHLLRRCLPQSSVTAAGSANKRRAASRDGRAIVCMYQSTFTYRGRETCPMPVTADPRRWADRTRCRATALPAWRGSEKLAGAAARLPAKPPTGPDRTPGRCRGPPGSCQTPDAKAGGAATSSRYPRPAIENGYYYQMSRARAWPNDNPTEKRYELSNPAAPAEGAADRNGD